MQMPPSDEERVAELLEQLLADDSLRARFRRDPVSAVRAAGLEGLAEEMASAPRRAMETLDLRESRSNLAGMLMAAAAEGIGLLDGAHGQGGRSHAVSDKLGRVSNAGESPPGDGAAGARASPLASEGGSRAAASPAPPMMGAPTPEQAAAEQVHGDAPGLWSSRSAAAAANQVEQANQARQYAAVQDPPEPGQGSTSPADYAGFTPDPDQYGMEGTGGPPVPGTDELLHNDHVSVDADGIADLKAGRIDPRVVSVLTEVAKKHDITISAMASDHDQYTAGGSVSNHYYGRAFDISVVDGQPVNPGNAAAQELATSLDSLPESIRPSEVGSPWALPGSADFSDAAHQNHVHIGFDDEISRDWRPPGVQDQAGQGSGSANGGGAGQLADFGGGYPGDDASPEEFAGWMGAEAEKRGIPPELPVMAALVESNLENLNYGDADSIGFFQMRVSIWDQGEYAGYGSQPEKQIDWFLDTAEAVKKQRLAAGLRIDDPSQYGEWIADVERPAAEYRGRYQPMLAQAQGLLKNAPAGSDQGGPVLVADQSSGASGGGEPDAAPAPPVVKPPDTLTFAVEEEKPPEEAQADVQFLEALPDSSDETDS